MITYPWRSTICIISCWPEVPSLHLGCVSLVCRYCMCTQILWVPVGNIVSTGLDTALLCNPLCIHSAHSHLFLKSCLACILLLLQLVKSGVAIMVFNYYAMFKLHEYGVTRFRKGSNLGGWDPAPTREPSLLQPWYNYKLFGVTFPFLRIDWQYPPTMISE